MANPIGSGLVVTGQTSLQQLRSFVDGAGEGMRIKGERLENGDIRLYAKPQLGRFSILRNLATSVRTNRMASQEAVFKVFENHRRDTGGIVSSEIRSAVKPEIKKDIQSSALKHLLSGAATRISPQQLHTGLEGPKVRDTKIDGGRLEQSLTAIATQFGDARSASRAYTSLKTQLDTAGRAPPLDNEGRSTETDEARTARLAKVEQLTTQVAAALGPMEANGKALMDSCRDLGRTMAKSLMDAKPSDADIRNVVFSMGVDFKAELLQSISPHLSLAECREKLLDTEAGSLDLVAVDAVYDSFAAAVSPNKLSDDGAKLTAGGHDADRGALLGEGGFGRVNTFALGGKDVAVKVSVQNLDLRGTRLEIASNFLKEALAHERLTATGSANILPFLGLARSETGALAIMTPVAKLGTVDDFAKKLAFAEQNQLVSNDQAALIRLTIMKDAISAIALMHENGMAHRDVKGGNLFLSEEGTVLAADVGGAMDLLYADPRNDAGTTKAYLAPEIDAVLNKDLAPRLDTFDGSTERQIGTDEMARLFPTLDEGQRAVLLDQIRDAVLTEDELAGRSMDRSDNFALGATAFKMLHDKNIAVVLEEYLQNPFNSADDFIVVPDDSEHGVVPTGPLTRIAAEGLQTMNQLIIDLGQRSGSARLTAREALNHAGFSLPGLGSAETREALKFVGGLTLPTGPIPNATPPSPVDQALVVPPLGLQLV